MISWKEYIENCIKGYHIILFKFQDNVELGVGAGEEFDKQHVYCGEHVLSFMDVGKTIEYPYHSITRIIKYGEA